MVAWNFKIFNTRISDLVIMVTIDHQLNIVFLIPLLFNLGIGAYDIYVLSTNDRNACVVTYDYLIGMCCLMCVGIIFKLNALINLTDALTKSHKQKLSKFFSKAIYITVPTYTVSALVMIGLGGWKYNMVCNPSIITCFYLIFWYVIGEAIYFGLCFLIPILIVCFCKIDK